LFLIPAIAGKAEDLVHLQGRTMGTVYSLQWVGASSQPAPRQVREQVEARLQALDETFYTYRSDSELSRFNTASDADWHEVSSELLFVLSRALEIARLSQGAFDPTVKPFVDLWGFGAGPLRAREPDPAQIAQAFPAVGFALLEIDADQSRIRKHHPGLQLDLCGIAKGYAVDEVSRVLCRLHLSRHLVEIGGELRATGRDHHDRPWRVLIEPASQRKQPAVLVDLEDRSLATSGGYRQRLMHSSRAVSHTIDPKTGSPVQNDLLAASVLADDCLTADALATVCMVLGSASSLDFAEAHAVPALLQISAPGQFLPLQSSPGRGLFQTQAVPAAASALRVPVDLPQAMLVLVTLALCGLTCGMVLQSRVRPH
jgi:thiamine biosynthesis lipoprotein